MLGYFVYNFENAWLTNRCQEASAFILLKAPSLRKRNKFTFPVPERFGNFNCTQNAFAISLHNFQNREYTEGVQMYVRLRMFRTLHYRLKAFVVYPLKYGNILGHALCNLMLCCRAEMEIYTFPILTFALVKEPSTTGESGSRILSE